MSIQFVHDGMFARSNAYKTSETEREHWRMNFENF